jgi:putative heme utilization carrier protein HutX
MERIISYLNENKGAATYSAAKTLGIPEKQVLDALPDQALSIPVEDFREIMDTISEWGDITMIVTNESVIFEVKGALPKGSFGHGFFNLHQKGNPVGGHLMADSFGYIYLVSRPFMGKESHSVQIFDKKGNASIKLYLGRDEKGAIKNDQLEKFAMLKKRYNQ